MVLVQLSHIHRKADRATYSAGKSSNAMVRGECGADCHDEGSVMITVEQCKFAKGGCRLQGQVAHCLVIDTCPSAQGFHKGDSP